MARGYTTKAFEIDGPDGPLKLLVLDPETEERPLPGVLWIHGGGYALGMPSLAHFSRAADIAKAGQGIVVSPAYRLASVAPYPAALEDCYAALLYMKKHATDLGIRSDQLFIGGESAGGGLTAAICMLARDRGEVSVAFQMPLYPMLDCFDTETSRDNHAHIWGTRRNHWGWRKYLGSLAGSHDIPAYASPARQTDYTGLPPAYTFICEGEPFYAETVAYIENLQAAGIDAEYDVYPGNTHAFDMIAPMNAQSRKAAHTFMERYRDAVRTRFAPQPEAFDLDAKNG